MTNIILTCLIILMVYSSQFIISCIINILYNTRDPKNTWDLIKLTFLPYAIYAVVTNKNK